MAVAQGWSQDGAIRGLHGRVRQVLLLWDRILGFDTLEILPVMAASIFHFRAKVAYISQ